MANIVIIDQKTVIVEGAEIIGAISEDQTVYVPLRQFSDFLGLDWSAQRRRTTRHHFYPEHLSTVAITATDGKEREQLALPIDLIHGWLLGINPERVKDPETAEKIRLFQRVAHRVLYEAFTPQVNDRISNAIIGLDRLPDIALNQVGIDRDIKYLYRLVQRLEGLIEDQQNQIIQLNEEIEKLKRSQ